jgi:hypothetical protein
MSAIWDMLRLPFRRGPRVPLAARRPDRDALGQAQAVPLGMEATDLEVVDQASRRNDALERTHSVATRRNGSYKGRASTHVNAMPEDETYAARYHRAFNKKDS